MPNLDAGFGGGTNSGRYYGRLYFNENSINTAANTSNVSLNLVIASNNGAYSFFGFNNNGQISINGGQVASGNYTGTVNTTERSICSWSGDLGHDSAGNLTVNISFSISSGYAGGSSNNYNWPLTHINRYATIPYFNITEVTDSYIQFSWGSSDNVDYVSWWSNAYDGGGRHDILSSGRGAFSITLDNLKSESAYDITVAVRRADSGLWTNSGTANPVTDRQNKYFNTMGL